MMATGIYSKKVTRWYFKGKGYASESMAYRAAAKDAMKDFVLGPRVPVSDSGTDCFGREFDYEWLGGRAKLEGFTGDAKERIRELYADAFPHYGGDNECYAKCYTNDDGDHLHRSCQVAQKRWLANKIQELKRQDALAQKGAPDA